MNSGAVTDDELVGDVVQVRADDLRLRTDAEHVIPRSLDQSGLPTAATAPSVSQV
jgi:hypothetical protein